MPSGAPYQPAFWFGEQSIILGLVTDDEGHPLGYADSVLGGNGIAPVARERPFRRFL